MKPAKHQYTILKQICQHIPAHLVPKLARSFEVDKKHAPFRLGHISWPCCMCKLPIAYRSMTWLIHCVIIREFWLQFVVQHRQAETDYRMQTALETPIWHKHSSGMCCPISKATIPILGVVTSIPVCQGGSNE